TPAVPNLQHPLSLHDALPILFVHGEQISKASASANPGAPENPGAPDNPGAPANPGSPPTPHIPVNVPRGNTRARRSRFKIFATRDRKSTRLNSSHLGISYAVF